MRKTEWMLFQLVPSSTLEPGVKFHSQEHLGRSRSPRKMVEEMRHCHI